MVPRTNAPPRLPVDASSGSSRSATKGDPMPRLVSAAKSDFGVESCRRRPSGRGPPNEASWRTDTRALASAGARFVWLLSLSNRGRSDATASVLWRRASCSSGSFATDRSDPGFSSIDGSVLSPVPSWTERGHHPAPRDTGGLVLVLGSLHGRVTRASSRVARGAGGEWAARGASAGRVQCWSYRGRASG
jgi:hypothetical protein